MGKNKEEHGLIMGRAKDYFFGYEQLDLRAAH
jgi:hypothetical protein